MAKRSKKQSDHTLFDDEAGAAAPVVVDDVASGNGRDDGSDADSGGAGHGGGEDNGGSGNRGGRGGAGGGGFSDDGPGNTVVALHEAARVRYLNYSLSVITSRALPDVRDGLKPVQRRILYSMWDQRITFDAKHRKCAGVVGEVMGKFHPHGDSAIYDALVRMAQSFSLRYPLIDGSGNFGSLDGDPAAAFRYTECRLARISDEMLREIGQKTVHFRPNYDGTREEPTVLPARIPNLLINGSTGIAVAMATNIPPHNLREIIAGLIRMLDAQLAEKEISNRELCRTIKGPDFPTGGQIISTSDEIKQIYETGQGSIKLRGQWEEPKLKKGQVNKKNARVIYITSIPYTVNKSQLIEQIAQVVISRKLPLLLDVRDLSADDVRIELELKKDADVQKVMAYLYKHTALQTNFPVNLTCLVPTENPEVGAPDRLDLKSILWHFLHFRLEVVTKRLEHELEQLMKRLHLLRGFAFAFDILDDLIKIIRASEGKADAARKILAKYGVEPDGPRKAEDDGLDAEQIDAILELRLYRLARLEINLITDELNEKEKRAAEIRKLLEESTAVGRWSIVREELDEIQKTYGDSRRTIIEDATEEPEYSAEDFIIAEDTVVIVTRDGWVKRQKEVKDLATTRVREGDSVLTAEAGSTRSTIAFFTNFGVCYSMRMIDVPATTGYGEPIQRFFKFADGEQVIAAFSMDPRVIGELSAAEGYEPEVQLLAATSDGYAFRLSLEAFAEPSTRSGRKYARPNTKKGVRVVGADIVHDEVVIALTREARALLCKAEEINYLAGPGKGVQLIKLSKDDELMGFKLSTGDRDLMRYETSRGGEDTVSTTRYELTSRGGRGRELKKNTKVTRIIPEEPELPVLLEE